MQHNEINLGNYAVWRKSHVQLNAQTSYWTETIIENLFNIFIFLSVNIFIIFSEIYIKLIQNVYHPETVYLFKLQLQNEKH